MSGNHNQYNFGLDKTPANFVALTPLSFLARTAAIYPGHLSTIYEGRTFTWSETHTRCRRFASYLAGRGIGRGDTVAVMDNGVVVHSGAMKELAENEELQHSLLGLAL